MGNSLSASPNQRKYGWIPDKFDHRDYSYYRLNTISIKDIPEQVDLRPQCPEVYDQGHLGSCTAQSIAGAYQFEEMLQKNPDVFTPSQLFIYYNEREIEGTIGEDSGANLRDGIKSISEQGVCTEKSWPYDITKFTQKPPSECYDEAQKHKGLIYARLDQSVYQLKHCLSEGNPIMFGMSVYSNFETEEMTKTGILTMPGKDDKLLGGHAVLLVGYTNKHFIVRNSWGSSWGMDGYFYMPYEYLLNSKLACDFWTLKKVSSQ